MTLKSPEVRWTRPGRRSKMSLKNLMNEILLTCGVAALMLLALAL